MNTVIGTLAEHILYIVELYKDSKVLEVNFKARFRQMSKYQMSLEIGVMFGFDAIKKSNSG